MPTRLHIEQLQRQLTWVAGADGLRLEPLVLKLLRALLSRCLRCAALRGVAVAGEGEGAIELGNSEAKTIQVASLVCTE